MLKQQCHIPICYKPFEGHGGQQHQANYNNPVLKLTCASITSLHRPCYVKTRNQMFYVCLKHTLCSGLYTSKCFVLISIHLKLLAYSLVL